MRGVCSLKLRGKMFMNPIHALCSFANYPTLIPGIVSAFQKGTLAAQDFIRKTTKVILNFNAETFRAQFADPTQFFKPIDIMIGKFENMANSLPHHLRLEYWEYVRTILKEEMTAFLQSQQFSAESIKHMCDYIDTLVDKQPVFFANGFAN
jgi:hypothetical protein